jgi:flagellar hook protein FlgE
MTTAMPCHVPAQSECAAVNELTILGNGFFMVRDPNNSEFYATQAGSFRVDARGYLVTESGARLQGGIGRDLVAIGDVQINIGNLAPFSATKPCVLYYVVDERGRILARLANRSLFLCGQILLQNFDDPQALVSEGGTLYSNTDKAGPLPAPSVPGSQGLGAIHSGMIEFSRAASPNWRN